MIVEPETRRHLASQALRRPLTPEEATLAGAIEEIFASGEHDFSVVAARLNERRIARPSGAPESWSIELLQRELELINHSLDAAYSAALPISAYR